MPIPSSASTLPFRVILESGCAKPFEPGAGTQRSRARRSLGLATAELSRDGRPNGCASTKVQPAELAFLEDTPRPERGEELLVAKEGRIVRA